MIKHRIVNGLNRLTFSGRSIVILGSMVFFVIAVFVPYLFYYRFQTLSAFNIPSGFFMIALAGPIAFCIAAFVISRKLAKDDLRSDENR